MAKIGTAHIEIKPVIDEAALAAIVERLTAAIAGSVAQGIRRANVTKSIADAADRLRQ